MGVGYQQAVVQMTEKWWIAPWEVFSQGSIFVLTFFCAPITLIVVSGEAQKGEAPMGVIFWGY